MTVSMSAGTVSFLLSFRDSDISVGCLEAEYSGLQ